MASQKKTVDVNSKAWREFSAWINGKDARGGKAAQDALAKERSIRIMKQYGPKLVVPGTIGTAKPPVKKTATTRQPDRVTPPIKVGNPRQADNRGGGSKPVPKKASNNRRYTSKPGGRGGVRLAATRLK